MRRSLIAPSDVSAKRQQSGKKELFGKYSLFSADCSIDNIGLSVENTGEQYGAKEKLP
jgi:hypothetical protein